MIAISSEDEDDFELGKRGGAHELPSYCKQCPHQDPFPSLGPQRGLSPMRALSEGSHGVSTASPRRRYTMGPQCTLKAN